MQRNKAAQVGRKKRSQLIFVAIIAAVLAGIAYGVYSYALNPPRTATFGAPGSTHEHAAFRLFINNQAVDFSQAKY